MFKYCSDHIVKIFIEENNSRFNKKLTQYFNFSRVVCLADFDFQLKCRSLQNFTNVAVISPSDPQDPELNIINYDHLDLLSYDNVNNLYNLDDDWSSDDRYENIKKFDLTLCSQVLEHIYSPFQALKNLSYITQVNGYIWVSIPTINCIHGEPYFYSSGYHPRYLSRLANEVGLECLYVGAWGNRKYISSAVLGKWLTHDQLKPNLNKITNFFINNPFIDGRLNDTTGMYIADTWALMRKK